MSDTTVQAGTVVPAAGPTGRLADLLTAVCRQRGEWTTKRVMRLYLRLPSTREIPPGRLREVARGDLRDLHAWGHLERVEQPGRLYYRLNTQKDVRK